MFVISRDNYCVLAQKDTILNKILFSLFFILLCLIYFFIVNNNRNNIVGGGVTILRFGLQTLKLLVILLKLISLENIWFQNCLHCATELFLCNLT